MTYLLTRSRDTEKVLVKLEQANILTEKGIRRAWFAVGKDLKASANKEILRRPKGGRTYIRRDRAGRRRRHVASAPFETHANMTGALRKSIGWKVRGVQLEYGYGATKPAPSYAPFVELGTTKMEPRPSIQNSIKENRRNTERHLSDSVLRELI